MASKHNTEEAGYGQGLDPTVHRTRTGRALCGAETRTAGDADSANDLIVNHGYTLCLLCEYALAMIEPTQ